MHDKSNTKDAAGVTQLNQDNVFLRFYTKRVCLFKVQDKQKRLNVVIFNQTYNPPSTFESFKADGLSGLGLSWENIFSMRGLSFIAFMLMIGLLFLNQTMCRDVQKQMAVPERADVPDGVHPYEYAEGEERPEEPA